MVAVDAMGPVGRLDILACGIKCSTKRRTARPSSPEWSSAFRPGNSFAAALSLAYRVHPI